MFLQKWKDRYIRISGPMTAFPVANSMLQPFKFDFYRTTAGMSVQTFLAQLRELRQKQSELRSLNNNATGDPDMWSGALVITHNARNPRRANRPQAGLTRTKRPTTPSSVELCRASYPRLHKPGS